MTEIARWRNSTCYGGVMARIEECIAGTASWWRWALDQLGHAGLGTAYALPSTTLILTLTAWGIPVTMGVGAVAALSGGVIREVIHAAKTGKAHPLDRSVDALFHLLGAPLALGIVQAARTYLF
jgi:hypothetical protein